MKLLDQVHTGIRKRHYSIRTEPAYLAWIKGVSLLSDERPSSPEGKERCGIPIPCSALLGRFWDDNGYRIFIRHL